MTLGVPEPRLLEWVRAGLIQPAVDADGHPDETRFELRDAALVRSLCDHHGTGPRAPKLRATLDRLRRWMPGAGEPLGVVTFIDRDGPLLVRCADGRLADENGQFRFDFEEADHETGHAPIGRIGPHAATMTPTQWHERGIAQEQAGELLDAVYSYGEALLIGGPDAQVTFDLAYTLTLLGERDRAIERYRQVLELDPRRADAWINLGDLLLSEGHHGPAIDAFRRALDLDPDDPAAHFNLADAFDATCDVGRAAMHWEAFLRLSHGSSGHTRYARFKLEEARMSHQDGGVDHSGVTSTK